MTTDFSQESMDKEQPTLFETVLQFLANNQSITNLYYTPSSEFRLNGTQYSMIFCDDAHIYSIAWYCEQHHINRPLGIAGSILCIGSEDLPSLCRRYFICDNIMRLNPDSTHNDFLNTYTKLCINHKKNIIGDGGSLLHTADGTMPLMNRIHGVIFDLDVPTHLNGYRYMISAISLSIESPRIMHQVTKTLYPQLASLFNSTPARIERSIRNALEHIWMRGNFKEISRYFGNVTYFKSGRVSNAVFIHTITQTILAGLDLYELTDPIPLITVMPPINPGSAV